MLPEIMEMNQQKFADFNMMKVTGSMMENKKHYAFTEMRKQHQIENQQNKFLKQQ